MAKNEYVYDKGMIYNYKELKRFNKVCDELTDQASLVYVKMAKDLADVLNSFTKEENKKSKVKKILKFVRTFYPNSAKDDKEAVNKFEETFKKGISKYKFKKEKHLIKLYTEYTVITILENKKTSRDVRQSMTTNGNTLTKKSCIEGQLIHAGKKESVDFNSIEALFEHLGI